MQDFCKKDCDISFWHSMNPGAYCVSLWADSQIQQSSLSESLSLKMGNPSTHDHNVKPFDFPILDQDSTSTQSTGQSYHEIGSGGKSNSFGPNFICLKPDCDGTQGKHEVGQIKSTPLTRNQEASQLNYGQPYACVPFSYPYPCHSELLAACTSETMMPGIGSGRVPLPLELPQNDPIYVNAKQYHAILRRRQYRAKLEAQNKLSKARKPYLHESRHLHALKRRRGPGGRFINTNNLPQSNPAVAAKENPTASQLPNTADLSKCKIYHSKVNENWFSTSSDSDITSTSISDNVFQQQEIGVSLYNSPTGSFYGENLRYLAIHHQ